MKLPLEIIQSKSGASYLGIRLCYKLKSSEQSQLESIFNSEFLERCFANRKVRDGERHHITIMSPREFSMIDKPSLHSIANLAFDLVVQPVSAVHTKGATVFFAPVECGAANEYRRSYGLGVRDFHITIGLSLIHI